MSTYKRRYRKWPFDDNKRRKIIKISNFQNRCFFKIFVRGYPLQNDQNRLDQSLLEERVKMTRLRQTIASRLKEAQNTAAMLTTYNEADLSEIINLRKQFKDQFFDKHDVKLGFMSFFVKACCRALEEVPEVNAQIEDEYIVFKKYINMGVAVGTENGLVVPVLKNADQLSFSMIEKEINRLGLLARDGKLSITDV